MALKKDITLENGIVLTYHRIVGINNITNVLSIIEIASYLNREQREKEIQWYNSNSSDNMNVYIHSTCCEKEYDKYLTVDDAYEYLKQFEPFIGAEDIFEADKTHEGSIDIEEPIPEEITENTEESTETDEVIMPEEIIEVETENTEEIPEESIETEEIKEEE